LIDILGHIKRPIMKDKELFQKAIGMDPWVVFSYEFDPDKGRLYLKLNFLPGSTFICPECNTEGWRVNDTEKKSWRRLNFSNTKLTSMPGAEG
jgi:hypothetical protein